MQLHEFKADKGAPSISADELDKNFRKLRPLPVDGPSRQYAITETPDGWKLTFFVDNILKSPENAESNLTQINQVDLSLLNGLQLVEVERCDGQRMRVLGTGWY
jgi:hypothetical protein